MSDDLAANAANWVPPWQRPAGAEPDAEAEAEVSAEASGDDAEGGPAAAGSRLPGQWDRLAGAKWQAVRPAESDDEFPDDAALDQELSDPQLSDCVSEDDGQLDDADSDAGSGSWNARAESPDADAGQAESLSGDGQDVAAPSGDEDDVVAGSEDEDDAPALSGDEDDVVARSEDEDEDDVVARSEDEQDAPALVGDERDAGELGGDGQEVVGRSGDGESRTADGLIGDGREGFEQGQLFVPAQRVSEDQPGIGQADLVPALEAILMVVDEPVGEIVLAQVLEVPAERVADALLELSARYTEEGKGFDLRRAAGGWRFYTRAEYSPYVEKFVLDGQQLRLTQASLETLAVVAYKQPVTRSRISAIRGVNCDGVVRTLITRGLIEECGTEPESGAHLYRTTNLFLEKLGLDSVEQLPPLAPFLPDNLDEVAANE